MIIDNEEVGNEETQHLCFMKTSVLNMNKYIQENYLLLKIKHEKCNLAKEINIKNVKRLEVQT